MYECECDYCNGYYPYFEEFYCFYCGEWFEIDLNKSGYVVNCPYCGNEILVPID